MVRGWAVFWYFLSTAIRGTLLTVQNEWNSIFYVLTGMFGGDKPHSCIFPESAVWSDHWGMPVKIPRYSTSLFIPQGVSPHGGHTPCQHEKAAVFNPWEWKSKNTSVLPRSLPAVLWGQGRALSVKPCSFYAATQAVSAKSHEPRKTQAASVRLLQS